MKQLLVPTVSITLLSKSAFILVAEMVKVAELSTILLPDAKMFLLGPGALCEQIHLKVASWRRRLRLGVREKIPLADETATTSNKVVRLLEHSIIGLKTNREHQLHHRW
jgi:hypothetical protein